MTAVVKNYEKFIDNILNLSLTDSKDSLFLSKEGQMNTIRIFGCNHPEDGKGFMIQTDILTVVDSLGPAATTYLKKANGRCQNRIYTS